MEFGNAGFFNLGEGKPEIPEKYPRKQGKNQKQSTHGDPGITPEVKLLTVNYEQSVLPIRGSLARRTTCEMAQKSAHTRQPTLSGAGDAQKMLGKRPVLYKTQMSDSATLFKTEFKFFVPCLRHLTNLHTLFTARMDKSETSSFLRERVTVSYCIMLYICKLLKTRPELRFL